MIHYKLLVASFSHKIATVAWAISSLLITLDTVFNYDKNPLWMIKLNVLLILFMLAVLALMLLNKIRVSTWFLIFCFGFTFYIYFPIYVGSEELGMALLSSTVRISACLLYVVLAALLSNCFEAMVLSGLNVLLIVLAIAINRLVEGGQLFIDPLIHFLFPAVAFFFWFLVRVFDKYLAANQEQIEAREQEHRLLTKAILANETMHNTVLALKVEERNQLIETIVEKLKLFTSEASSVGQKSILQQVLDDCTNFLNPVEMSEEELKAKDEKDFITWLKGKYPQLKKRKLVVCGYLLMDMPTKAIAQKMNLSEQTIFTYRKEIAHILNNKGNQSLPERLKSLHDEFIQSKKNSGFN